MDAIESLARDIAAEHHGRHITINLDQRGTGLTFWMNSAGLT